MIRKAALAFAVLLLCACTGQGSRAPFADSEMPPAMAPRFYPPPGWTWGLIKVEGQPAQRYGVSAPTVTARGNLLILTGYDDPAEAWFETIALLNRRGYVVWLLERAGQGGSGRLSRRRDLGHVRSFAPDAEAAVQMIRGVIRPGRDRPLVVLAHAEGAVVALQALAIGAPADALVLTSPALAPAGGFTNAAHMRLATRLGLGGLRAPGAGGWRREAGQGAAGRLTHDAVRGAVRSAWAQANPALRMGGPSIAWRAAWFEAAEAARAEAPRVAVPTLMLTAADDTVVDNAAARRLCRTMVACREEVIPGAWHDLPREADPERRTWLRAMGGFVRQQIRATGR